MSRLAESLQTDGRIRLVPYVMAGFPSARASIEIGRQYAALGAGAIEVGIPFSDPLADGPIIQQAGQQALAEKMTVEGAIEVAAEVATAGVPVVLMTYLNPLLSFGLAEFSRAAVERGVAGVIIPDLPVHELDSWQTLREAGLDTIFLAAPTSSVANIEAVCEESSGFVYCVTLTGVTGARRELDPGLSGLLGRLRSATPLPIAAGFGISRPEHLRQLRGQADAAVVASALLAEIIQGRDSRPLLTELIDACQ
ncbi:MAG: tryptophan synthase subunit alpha [Candidatus Dormibacteraceae bacterium]